MEIKHKQVRNRGKFYAENSGHEVGAMTYVFVGDTKFIIDHTEVDESYKGQGVGVKLVEAAVDHARANDLKVLPLCPFAKSVFDRRRDLADVLS